MKAGVMELPDVVVVTKADMRAPATRAKADVEGALTLYERRDGGWTTPVASPARGTERGSTPSRPRSPIMRAGWTKTHAAPPAASGRRGNGSSRRSARGSAPMGWPRPGALRRRSAPLAPFARERALALELARRLTRD